MEAEIKAALFTVFLLLAAAIDGKQKKIPIGLLAVFGTVGACFLTGQLWQALSGSAMENERIASVLLLQGTAFLPGLLSLFLTLVSRGAIGAGDGCFFLGAACYLNGKESWSLWIGGLLCSSLWGLCLLVWSQRQGKSVRKRRLPFLPFLIPVWIGMNIW